LNNRERSAFRRPSLRSPEQKKIRFEFVEPPRSGDDVEKRVEILSGGEKSRLVLATLLGKPLNFLILDEPTNHLDIASRDILLEALQGFAGTVVLVSHDRHFLRSLVNRVFEIDHGQLQTYDGDYGYYLHKSGREGLVE
jgi:ATP-binding cassette subfamily F protein 3